MEELIAKDGYVYALRSDLSVYGKRITLGVGDSVDNWVEIEEPKQEVEDEKHKTKSR